MITNYKVGSIASFISQKPSGKSSKEGLQKDQKLLDQLFTCSSNNKGDVINLPIASSVEKPVRKHKRQADDYTISATSKLRKLKKADELENSEIEKVLDAETAMLNDDDEDEAADLKPEKSSRSLKKQELKNIKRNKESKQSETDDKSVVLVKNLPNNVKRRTIQRYFAKIGKVNAVWLRCAALADPAVPKKVAVIKKDFHPERKSISAFVRFENPETAARALSLTGDTFQDQHITVTLFSEKKEVNKGVFVGNLPFSIEDEDLWQHFSECGKIVDVRIVRDQTNGIGKGFGYVNFESTDSVELALKLDQSMIKDRSIRVSRCKRNPKPHESKANKSEDKNTGAYRRMQSKKIKLGEKKTTSGWMNRLKQRKKTDEQGLPSFAGDTANQKAKPIKKGKIIKKNKDVIRKAKIAAKLASKKPSIN